MSEHKSFFEKNQIVLSIFVGAIIIAGAILYIQFGVPKQAQAPTTNETAQAPATNETAQAPAVNIADVKTTGDPMIGDPNAPVMMAIWFDYQCPFCRQLEQQVTPQVIDKYVKTGKVKIVFKDFQFLGHDSQTDALFARAVWNLYPNKFYNWYVAMFNAQDQENTGFGNLQSVETLTKGIDGIDVNKVVVNMNQNKTTYQQEIQADGAEAQAFGINGTPSVIIGKKLLVGFHPYTAISALLDAQLK